MSTSSQLYDSPTSEIYLLENVPIQGRKTELRQLLKLLNLTKNGQPKAVLVTGDPGIGKTALLKNFLNIVRQGIYSRIIDLTDYRFHSAEELYVAIIDAIRKDAVEIQDEALAAANDILKDLNLHWQHQDLERAVSLVKLQESIGGKQGANEERLAKAIRSSVPTVKKLRMSVNESIDKLVSLIINPWVIVATSIVHPIKPELKEAFQLAETLKAGYSVLESENLPVFPVAEQAQAEVEQLTHPENIQEDQEQANPVEEESAPDPANTIIQIEAVNGTNPVVANADETAEHGSEKTKAVITDESVEAMLPAPQAVQATSSDYSLGNLVDTPAASRRRKAEPEDPIELLVNRLSSVFGFINQHIQNIDTAVLLALDEWERILDLPGPAQKEMKAFLSGLLRETTDQKNFHMMVVLTARSAGESYSLGGSLYNLFRTKLLLSGLSDNPARKLIRTPLRQKGIELDEEIYQDIFDLTLGNPFWQLKMQHYLQERAESNKVNHITHEFYGKMGIDNLEDLLELTFTRVKLTFLNQEDNLYRTLAVLIKQFEERAFTAEEAIREISASQGVSNQFVFEVLRSLFYHNFLVEAQLLPGDHPRYKLQSRLILDFLKGRTKTTQTDISTNEKLGYLKKVIPLSVKSGELDREKTREVIALSNTMDNSQMIQFLEDVFVEHLRDEKPAVRVTALNNIALIDSERARQTLFSSMEDEDSMVREYAARNLAMLAQLVVQPQFHRQVVEVLIEYIDDESEAVRAQVYETLSKYRWNQDLVSVFIKGMADACDAVRVTSIKNLVDLDSDSPYLRNALLDAVDDPVSEVRKFACLGVQKFPDEETISVLVDRLRNDEDKSIRALAADSLSHMDDELAFEALVDAFATEDSEDVRLSVVRSLGKRRGWKSEEILLDFLMNSDELSDPLLWACIRSLGTVGGTERSISALIDLKRRRDSEIVQTAADLALKKIQGRLEELRQLERQLEEATPSTTAIPSEYEEEVEVPEDDPVDQRVY